MLCDMVDDWQLLIDRNNGEMPKLYAVSSQGF